MQEPSVSGLSKSFSSPPKAQELQSNHRSDDHKQNLPSEIDRGSSLIVSTGSDHCNHKKENNNDCECVPENDDQEEVPALMSTSLILKKEKTLSHYKEEPVSKSMILPRKEAEFRNSEMPPNKNMASQFAGISFGFDNESDPSSHHSHERAQPVKKGNPRLEINNQLNDLILNDNHLNDLLQNIPDGNSNELSDLVLRSFNSEIIRKPETKIGGLPALEFLSHPQSCILSGETLEEEKKGDFYKKFTKHDFEKFKELGGGAYASVYLVKRKNSKMYALKRMHKDFLIRERKDYQVFVEKEVLHRLRNAPKSNIVKLYSSFEDNYYIYFLMEYIDGGDFWNYLEKYKALPKEQIIFFTAQMVNILEYIHAAGIAHRDFKPENILLKTNGHMKCIDFGTAKFMESNKRTYELFENSRNSVDGGEYDGGRAARVTFNGTRYYVSPEVLENRDSGPPADLWALGLIVYLMTTAKHAFPGQSNYAVYEKIKNFNIEYPPNMDPEIKDFIQKLLVREPHMRLGAGIKGSNNDYEALKKHPLFKGLDFEKVHLMKLPIFKIESTFSKERPEDENDNKMPDIEGITTRRKAHSQQQIVVDKRINLRNEAPILSDSVKKNLGWLIPIYKERQLILTPTRLIYYDPSTDEALGEIPLRSSTVASVFGSQNKNKFKVQVPDREYIFKEGERPAKEWVKAINETVAALHKKK